MLDDGGEVMALVFYWLYAGMVYVGFGGVNPAMRGRNIEVGVVEQVAGTLSRQTRHSRNRTSAGEMAMQRASFYERLRIRFQSVQLHPTASLP